MLAWRFSDPPKWGETQTTMGVVETAHPRGQKDAEMVSPGSALPVSVARQYLYPLFFHFGYECWGYHLLLGEIVFCALLVSCSEVL